MPEPDRVYKRATAETRMKANTATRAVVLAAGHGSRAYPLTSVCPKALLPLGEETLVSRLVRQCQGLGLDVTVVVGENDKRVAAELKSHSVFADVEIVEAGAGENLFKSLTSIGGGNYTNGLIWMGASMVLSSADAIGRLTSERSEFNAFCALYQQSTYQFRPTLVFEGGKLAGFDIGDPLPSSTRISAPTIYCVDAEFLEYATHYDEERVFQAAIDDGRRFLACEMAERAVEVRTPTEFLEAQVLVNPQGFTCDESVIEQSDLMTSFVYGSEIHRTRLTNSIVLSGCVKDEELQNTIVAGDARFRI